MTRLEELKIERAKKYQELSKIKEEIDHIELKKYMDMVGKFYRINNDEYIYVFTAFRNGEGRWGEPSVILRGIYFYYVETEEWDGSEFRWLTDQDYTIDNIYNDLNSYDEITKEEFQKAFDEYHAKVEKHSKKMLDIAINEWAH